MKRRFVTKQYDQVNFVPIEIPDHLKDYADSLRLLNGIPLTYLLSDVSELPKESIRFFYVDINWTDALVDGAFSIGRVCRQECTADKVLLRKAAESRDYMETPRMKRMHSNHKKKCLKKFREKPEDYNLISGFIMHSQLAARMKGLHVYGFDKAGALEEEKGEQIPILRMETIADDVLLCLFSGDVQEILVEEPKTGLCFGASSVERHGNKITRSIDLRSAQDDSDLGKRICSFCIDDFTDDNGRIHAEKLAYSVGTQLKNYGKLGNDEISSSRFAFEMIAAAHRAKFKRSSGEV
ncbi:Uncharacterised protein [uncultured Roseburia sp.]|uniref:Uncharacterized protein n=1 Tax=Brotonthovivens ammoniilytica TaxID=2981725 RepID=A0ABT2TG76_9FIRM|nr:hypothetical protein [Brotonthovivens ammoniilytica]MCU6761188.1 hypothetical protein [Brotonthovivens ammoniilytica]SCI21419.1 Uncharacterised protein [uncultured Roseburia sp.]